MAEKRQVDLQQLPTNRSEGIAYWPAASLPVRGGGGMGTIPPTLKRTLGRQPERSMSNPTPY